MSRPATLSLRQLNRTLLARQMLLERAALPAAEAVERQLALQAQVVNPPYIGLWTRLQGFQRADLNRAMEARQVVRAAMMRSTLQTMTARDFLQFRKPIQPALVKALGGFFGERAAGLDIDALVQAARTALEERPRTQVELRALLLETAPGRVPEALAYAVRVYLPMVQVYPGGTWKRGGEVHYALPETHLGAAVAPDDDVRPLFLRYLAAYGPASVMDFQTWTGMTKMKTAVEQLRPQLVTYRSEDGIELFDLPDAALTPEDTTAPVRFLPEYDNIKIAHADRSRILPDDHRTRVFLSAGRVRSTILVDGFVAGAWKIERVKKDAVMVIEPFTGLAPDVRAAVEEEGERLLRWAEDDASTFSLRWDAVAS